MLGPYAQALSYVLGYGNYSDGFRDDKLRQGNENDGRGFYGEFSEWCVDLSRFLSFMESVFVFAQTTGSVLRVVNSSPKD